MTSTVSASEPAQSRGKAVPAGGRAKPSIRQQRLEHTRSAILASALGHFSRRGFEGASLRDIAQEAGVQHGMIRHIYQTKEELWRQAIGFLFERMESEMPPEISDLGQGEAPERFRTFIHWYVGYCARHPEHARLMIQQSILEGPELAWTAERYIRGRHQWHLPFIEKLQDSGHLPRVDPISVVLMVTAACQMPFLLAPEILAATGKNFLTQAAIKDHADAVTKIFLRNGG
ncbi:TetR/AcrR family transcriptional regulator [Sphingopyxis sp. MSC1_008]|jgi:TetR/AcrR family transcriptional regulator|uniref:TetR/AcrR family transcriptional regulator n=1 Tax=Sphingopyxis sp. MSC1_008 TaxID=2909265 RepID=UPI0020BE11B1|nr:TetR/AcrR family transcriptional regulator [Sphingopyxis sp. MSC1_008]